MNRLMNIANKIYYTTTEAASQGTTQSAEELSKQITDPMFYLLKIFAAAVIVWGAFKIFRGVSEFSNAWDAQDTASQAHAIRTIVSGILLVATPIILQLFGVDIV